MASHYISADYVSSLLEYAAKNGVPAEELLNTDTMPAVLNGLVPWSVASAVIKSYAQKCNDDCAGLKFGLTLGINDHGLLGYAAKSAYTPLEAILLDEKYLTTRSNAISFRVMSDAKRITVYLESALTLNSPDWRFLHLAILGSIARMYSDLFGKQFLDACFIVPFPTEALKKHKDPLLSKVHWQEQAGNISISAEADFLLKKNPLSDETLKKLLVDQCESLMPAAHTMNDTVSMVRNLLHQQLVEPPKVGQLCQQLNLPERTLKRYLQNAGTSYREILIELRVQAATHYLQTTNLSIDKIAFRLGYNSPSTFKSLFRRWTGKTPGEVRQSEAR